MKFNLDSDDLHADWLRARVWDLPTTAKHLIQTIGADQWEHFKTLPAFKAIPAGLEHDVEQYLSVKHLPVVKSQSDDGHTHDPVAARMGTAHYSQGRVLPLKKYSEDQERDDRGRFGSGGGSSDNSENAKLGIGKNGSATAHHAKEAYRQKYGVPDPVGEVNYRDLVCDKERAKEISDAYDALPLDDPAAHEAYDQLASEIAQQYDFLTNDLGITVQFVDHDPYPTAREMFQDVEGNKNLQVLSTAATGSHSYFSDETNDMFRAVHDYFGHAATGRGFMQDGEEAAWVSHSTMFSPEAAAALTSETRGQNSWVNNHDSGFADQKTALLPEKFWYAADAGYKFVQVDLVKYNESQERDDHGRFGSGGVTSNGLNSAEGKTLPKEQFIADWQSEGINEVDENGESNLKLAYEHYGMNGKPTVSDEKFQELKDNGATIIYRGVSKDSSTDLSPQEMTDQFRNGNTHYAGFGYDSNGTYTSTYSGTAKEYALAWDGTPAGGAVMEMAVKPDAKFIDVDEIEYKIATEVDDNPDYSNLEEMWLRDPANYALHLGYDGITVEQGHNENYYILLNRAAVVMPTKDLKWTA
jgi:hypothetical protein